MESMFYVYCYFNPLKPSTLHECGFEPFYVGKGKNNRKIHHLFESNLQRDPNRLKKNTILKIRKAGCEPHIVTLGEFENEDDAFSEERRLIALWGRRNLGLGPLANLTDGGDGPANRVYSDEQRKRISDAAKLSHKEGRSVVSVEFKTSMLGKKQTPEHVKKKADARRGSKHSDETRKKISDAHQRVRQTPEWKEKASLAQRGKKHSLEHTLKSIQSNPRSQPIELMGVKYLSIGQAIKATGLTPGQVRKQVATQALP